MTMLMRRFGRLVAAMAALLGSPTADVSAAEGLLWSDDGRPTSQATAVLEVLDHAEEYGLQSAEYAIDVSDAELQQIRARRADSALLQRFDRGLTLAATRFVDHLHHGRVSAAAAGFKLPAAGRKFDTINSVRQLASTSDVPATIATFEPRLQPYKALKQVLRRYRELADLSALNALPPLRRRALAAGDEYDGAPELRALLVAVGDLDPSMRAPDGSAMMIDSALADAIRRFQSRHGLQADGAIGSRTYAALTTPLTQRVRQIELTLERWRWLSDQPRPDIIINIPQFMLYALPRRDEPGEAVIEMPVIVGQGDKRTPVFTASIEQVIFHPFWDVPSSIVAHELLPAIRRNPAYLARHHFEIVRGAGDDAAVIEPTAEALDALAAGQLRLRQRPGPDNALGPVKFVLPNPYAVRLHGTPEQALFGAARRTFSHGCIRVSDPATLAEYVLRNASGEWNAAAVEAALCGTQMLRITLEKPLPMIVFYATAAATETHGVLFSEDIYGHDRTLEQLLTRRSVPSRSR